MTEQTPLPAQAAERLIAAGRYSEALPLVEHALVGQQSCCMAHGMLALTQHMLGRSAEASETIGTAMKLGEGGADAYDTLGYVALLLGEHDRSNALYQRALQLAPDNPRLWYNLASSERSFGRLEAAEAACDHVIALDASYYKSYTLRSDLRVQTGDSNHVAELTRLLARQDTDHRGRVALGYALGKELDDLRRFDEAFAAFSDAARLRRRHLAYEVASDEHKLGRICAVYSIEKLRAAVPTTTDPMHIFIMGLPRSGTTLIERVLSGLPGVCSNGETDNFSRALIAAAPHNGSDVFDRAGAADPTKVAQNYAKLAVRNNAARAWIEKLPINYLYLGAIALSILGCRLLLLRRSAVDVCFAMYRTLFEQGCPFSYDFADLARYYAAFEKLMSHWRRSLGDLLHEVIYEEFVHEPRRLGESVASFCGLTWCDAALAVDKTPGVSLTASAAQVRRPIYTSSAGSWRNYRAHLEPLVAALRMQGVPNTD